MQHIIITNNPLVAENYGNVFWRESGVAEILIKVRDRIYQGYELVSHPLAASLRMLYSPYRSIIISQHAKQLNHEHVQIIEDSIAKYNNLMGARTADSANGDDYKKLDLLLMESAIAEIKGKW